MHTETQTMTPELPVLTETIISVTEAAERKIGELQEEEGKQESGLRVRAGRRLLRGFSTA